MSAIPIARILKVSRTWLIARCIAACAHRTEILAQIAEIELAATKGDKISRGEVERAFAMAGAMIKAHIFRLAADAPCALLGCSPAEIGQWMEAAIRRPIEDISSTRIYLNRGKRKHDTRRGN